MHIKMVISSTNICNKFNSFVSTLPLSFSKFFVCANTMQRRGRAKYGTMPTHARPPWIVNVVMVVAVTCLTTYSYCIVFTPHCGSLL